MDLNTHRKHKNSTIVPRQGRATSQNFSEGERREKHLITSNPCEPFWSPKVLGCPRPCVCSVSGNDLPLHERCSVLQRGCLPRSSAAPFLVNSSFPGRRARRSSADRGLAAGRVQGRQGHRTRQQRQRGLLQGQAGPGVLSLAGSRKTGGPLCFLKNLFSNRAIKQRPSDTQHSRSQGTEAGPGEPTPAKPASWDPREGQRAASCPRCRQGSLLLVHAMRAGSGLLRTLRSPCGPDRGKQSDRNTSARASEPGDDRKLLST